MMIKRHSLFILFIILLFNFSIVFSGTVKNSHKTKKTKESKRKNKSKEKSQEYYISLGNEYQNKGQYEKAIAEYKKALKINPKLARAYLFCGNANACREEFDKAILDYNKALEIDPELAEAYNARGLLYKSKEEYDKAVADFTRAIELNPDYFETYFERGNAYFGKSEYDRAISDYTRYMESDPGYSEAYFNRGMAFSRKGEYDRALSDYNKVIELDPEDADIFYYRGRVYYEKGENDKAISDYNNSKKLNPKNNRPYYDYKYSRDDKDRNIYLKIAFGFAWYVLFLFQLVFHEAAHAYSAKVGGDDTAESKGLATFDPLPHIKRHPFGTVIVPIVSYAASGWVMGWGSCPYSPLWADRYPHRAGRMALFGPLSNLLLFLFSGFLLSLGLKLGWFVASGSRYYADLFSELVKTGTGIPKIIPVFLSITFTINLIIFLLNILPLPPLDGSSAITLLMKEPTARKWQIIMNYPYLNILGIIAAWKVIDMVFIPVFDKAVDALLSPSPLLYFACALVVVLVCMKLLLKATD